MRGSEDLASNCAGRHAVSAAGRSLILLPYNYK
jgi:hypothetical protein